MSLSSRFAAPATFSPPKRRRRARHEPAAFLENLSAVLGGTGRAARSVVSPCALPHFFRAPVVDPDGAPRDAGAGQPRRANFRATGTGRTGGAAGQNVAAEPLPLLAGGWDRP